MPILKYNWPSLNIGDTLFIPYGNPRLVRTAGRIWGYRHNCKFASAKVWRDEVPGVLMQRIA